MKKLNNPKLEKFLKFTLKFLIMLDICLIIYGVSTGRLF